MGYNVSSRLRESHLLAISSSRCDFTKPRANLYTIFVEEGGREQTKCINLRNSSIDNVAGILPESVSALGAVILLPEVSLTVTAAAEMALLLASRLCELVEDFWLGR